MQSHDNTVAYVSMRDSTGGSSSSRGRSSFRSQRGGFRGTFRGGGRQSSRGRGRIYSLPAIICQICGKGNHTALECWHRLDANFHQSLQPNSSSSQSSQVTSSGYTQPRAYVASAPSPSSSEAAPWYLDSAASDHITHDLSNLNLSRSYTGPDQITIGNGTSIPIHHIGKGLLPTPHFSFKLNKLLHAPISSNLLSVHQLTKDNNCTITFDDSSFVVQDKNTKAILHKGYNANGLYHFPYLLSSSSHPAAMHASHSSSTALLTTASACASENIWHQRLGHPSQLKFTTLKKHLSFPFNKTKSTTSLVHIVVWLKVTDSPLSCPILL
ncbi:unnamed protein product [Camellia sinensis]